jgi:exonuclease I
MIKQREINILKAMSDIRTDTELAKRLNMTPANFQALMQKKTGLTQADLIRIADACGVVYVSAFMDKKGKTLVGGVCSIAEIDEMQTKPRGTHSHHKANTQPNADINE